MWSASGYCLISIPVFFPKAKKLAQAVTAGSDAPAAKVDTAASAAVALEAAAVGDGLSVSQRTQSASILPARRAKRTEADERTLCARADYISNRRLLLSLADAGGRLMLSWKDLSALAGSTSRVYTLLSTLHDLSGATYAALARPLDLAPEQPFYDLGSLNGRLVDDAPVGEGVSFDKVPIVAPAPGVASGGEELVKRLSLRVKPGEHLLITGGNGSGKTAIARVLSGASLSLAFSLSCVLRGEGRPSWADERVDAARAGLWPVFEGVVARPSDDDIMFLPQRPYLSSGSLRDQCVVLLSPRRS